MLLSIGHSILRHILCSFQNPGGWVGGNFQGKSLLNYLHSFGTFPLGLPPQVKSYNLNQQTSRVLPSLHSLHLTEVLC